MRILLILLLIPFLSTGQQLKESDRLRIEVGHVFAPMVAFQPNIRMIKESLTPKIEASVGVSGLCIYASLGQTLELGMRAGNEYVLAGISYVYNGQTEIDPTHAMFFEIGYHTRHIENSRFILEVTMKHGFTKDLYIFSPINIGVKYLLNK